MDYNDAANLATGYVWGRQDAGDGSRDTSASWFFSRAYSIRNEAYRSEGAFSMIPVSDAWQEWVNDGRLTYRTRDGWKEITTVTERGATRVVHHNRPVFDESDPVTWRQRDLPTGYEWREFDAASGEEHLYAPDGRDVTAEADGRGNAS